MPTASITNTIADASSRVQKDAADAFRTSRIATADVLASAADRVNAGGDNVARAAHATADSLDASATYIRGNGAREMVRDVEGLIKAHPGKALIGAVLVGFFAGRMFRRD